MLINLRTMLKAASAKKMAVGAFNVYNVESLQAVLAATKASNHAVILSFGEKYDQHMPIEAMAELVKFYGHTSSQPIVLHLDHCKQESNVIRAIRAGFTSIMYDGSHLPVAENASRSAEIVRICISYDAFIGCPLYKPDGYRTDRVTTGITLSWRF